MLWALDNPLRPQAATTGGLGVEEAICLVGFREITPAAESAWSKGKALHPFPVSQVFGIIPQINQGPLP